MKSNIILVEDDPTLGLLLSEYLSTKGFEVVWAENGAQALLELEKNTFDLAVLDVMMPEMDGFSLANEIRKKKIACPFLFLTARSLKNDALKGLALGAIDYIRKPVDEEELVMKITNILYNLPKKSSQNTEIIELGNYQFSANNQELIHQTSTKKLTKRESDLLLLLIENKNSISSHTLILEKLWGEDDYFNRQSLNVFITRLRKYVAQDEQIKIENIHNQGFRLSF